MQDLQRFKVSGAEPASGNVWTCLGTLPDMLWLASARHWDSCFREPAVSGIEPYSVLVFYAQILKFSRFSSSTGIKQCFWSSFCCRFTLLSRVVPSNGAPVSTWTTFWTMPGTLDSWVMWSDSRKCARLIRGALVSRPSESAWGRSTVT